MRYSHSRLGDQSMFPVVKACRGGGECRHQAQPAMPFEGGGRLDDPRRGEEPPGARGCDREGGSGARSPPPRCATPEIGWSRRRARPIAAIRIKAIGKWTSRAGSVQSAPFRDTDREAGRYIPDTMEFRVGNNFEESDSLE
jgi:hypothetical protein